MQAIPEWHQVGKNQQLWLSSVSVLASMPLPETRRKYLR